MRCSFYANRHNLIVFFRFIQTGSELLSAQKKTDKKIQLDEARKSVNSFGLIHPENHITKQDIEKLGFADEMRKLKSIHKERMLEDLSCLLNDKIREFEKIEQEDKWKESMLQNLNTELHSKVMQLEQANKTIADEKARSDELNKKLQETLLKLQSSEEQLRLERDWLAQQVEQKSKEVLETIREMIKNEKPQ